MSGTDKSVIITSGPDNHGWRTGLGNSNAYLYIQSIQEKLCFFTNHCNPSLAYIAVRDLHSSQHNSSVQSLLLTFCTTNNSRVLVRERWQTFENSWKKTQYILNTLYVINVYAETYSPYSLCRRILVGGEGQPVTTIYVWFFCGLSSFNGTLFRKHKSGW